MGCLRCAAGGMALACAVHVAADAVVGTLLVLLKPRWERFLPLYAALNGAPQRVVARPALPRKAACPGLERIGVPCGPPKVGVWGASRMPQKMLWFIVHMKKNWRSAAKLGRVAGVGVDPTMMGSFSERPSSKIDQKR